MTKNLPRVQQREETTEDMKRDVQKKPIKKTYKRDLQKRPIDMKRYLLCVSCACHPSAPSLISSSNMKETYKRDLQKRPTKETCKRDLQKRPVDEKRNRPCVFCACHPSARSRLKTWKEIHKRDLQKTPTKETNRHDTKPTMCVLCMSSLSAIADIEQQQREEEHIWAHPDNELVATIVPPPVKGEEHTLDALNDRQVSLFFFFFSYGPTLMTTS